MRVQPYILVAMLLSMFALGMMVEKTRLAPKQQWPDLGEVCQAATGIRGSTTTMRNRGEIEVRVFDVAGERAGCRFSDTVPPRLLSKMIDVGPEK